MECLVLPVLILSRRCSGSRLGYRALTNDLARDTDGPVTVVVGKEEREFLVDPFVLEEHPFRNLIEMMRKEKKAGTVGLRGEKKQVLYVDVDAILFEHMLWLMQNDFSSLFQLNLKEIVEFYALDY